MWVDWPGARRSRARPVRTAQARALPPARTAAIPVPMDQCALTPARTPWQDEQLARDAAPSRAARPPRLAHRAGWCSAAAGAEGQLTALSREGQSTAHYTPRLRSSRFFKILYKQITKIPRGLCSIGLTRHTLTHHKPYGAGAGGGGGGEAATGEAALPALNLPSRREPAEPGSSLSEDSLTALSTTSEHDGYRLYW